MLYLTKGDYCKTSGKAGDYYNLVFGRLNFALLTISKERRDMTKNCIFLLLENKLFVGNVTPPPVKKPKQQWKTKQKQTKQTTHMSRTAQGNFCSYFSFSVS